MAQEEEQPAEDKLARKQVTKKDLKRQQKEALQAQRRELLAAREKLQQQFNKLDVSGEDSAASVSENTENEIAQTSDASASTASPQTEESSESTTEKSVEEQIVAEKLANRVHIPVTTCLFCPAKKQLHFATLEENLDHMFKAHGLYIPEKKYLVDPEGLIGYLGEKIGLGNVCLVCSYQGKNIEAVREHMCSKRHMKIPYETEDEKLEIGDFYDFTSSYGDIPQSESGNDNEDWEDVSDDGEGEGEGDEDEDEDYENTIPEDPIIDMGTELILPSGAVVGHRSMAKYYKQNFPPERVLSEGQGTVIAAETRHFANPVLKEQLAITKRAWGHQKKREDTNDRRAQKFINNQPHFRDPLLQ